jgi:hypothetical protein
MMSVEFEFLSPFGLRLVNNIYLKFSRHRLECYPYMGVISSGLESARIFPFSFSTSALVNKCRSVAEGTNARAVI